MTATISAAAIDLLNTLKKVCTEPAAAAIEDLIIGGPDYALNRVNPVSFAMTNRLTVPEAIGGFLHATQLGLFQLAWNVVCASCGGVLQSAISLQAMDKGHYSCALCGTDCEVVLDDRVEVTFTVSPTVRSIPAHHPERLSLWDYVRQVYWSSGSDLPQDLSKPALDVSLGAFDVGPAERLDKSLTFPAGFIVAFDPVTHTSTVVEASGEDTNTPQDLAIAIADGHWQGTPRTCRPGPVNLSIENHTDHRVLPILWIAGEDLKQLVGRRLPYLSAKGLLSNQTFRELYRTDVLGIDQRFTILSLTFLFTDLKGSTDLYRRVGDLAAFDLVRNHFQRLTEIISKSSGAVVKTIGDAVMATFATPEAAVTAALQMQDAMNTLHGHIGHDAMMLKIGLHAGPCLAVLLNDRQDYFGQTVNIAARVQDLASAGKILATDVILNDSAVQKIVTSDGHPVTHSRSALRGVGGDFALHEIG